jgi:lambda family phage portal protein
MKLSNLFDSALAVVAPRMAVKRLHAREVLTELSHRAARPGRERKLAPSSGNQSPDSSANNRDRVQLIWEARELEENFPLLTGLLGKLALYTFGSLKYQARTSDKDINAKYEAYFEEWSEGADSTGRHDFNTIVSLAFTSMIRDGDIGINMRLTPDGWKLQYVEADRIGRPGEGSIGETYLAGITTDEETGAPVQYRVYNRTREGMYIDPVEVPASQFIHLFDPKRLDQARGTTHFASAIDTARDICDVMQSERFAARWAAAQTGVVKNEAGEGSAWDSPKGADGLPLEKIQFGQVNYLRPGESMETFRSERPSVTFSGFMQALQRDVCLSLGVSYGFFVDSSALGGAAGRLDSQQANRVCNRYQRIFVSKFLNRVKNAVIAFGISFDGLPSCPDWKAGKWQFPAWPSSDLGRESASNLEEWKAGARTMSDIYAERNEDWEEQLLQLGRERKRIKEIAEEMGVQIEEISQRFPNQQAGAPQPGQPPSV